MESTRALIENLQDILQLSVWALAAFAFWRGAGPEKAAAATLFLLMVLDDIYHLGFGPYYPLDRVDPWHAFLDTAALISFTAIALQANRFYPMVLASAQLVSVTAHIVRATVPAMTSLSYYLLYVMPFYFAILVLAGGLWRHYSRHRRIGPYREWRGPPPTGPSLFPQ